MNPTACLCRRLRTTVAFALLGLVSSTAVFAAEYYVSPQGNDANAGTVAAPWRLIITAVIRSGPGDTIYLRGGIYTEGEVWIRDKAWSGTPGNYKVIRNYPGETPSLGGNRRLINQADWLRFEGLHFRLGYVFDNNRGDHVQLIHCVLEGPQPDYGAISFSGQHGLIEGNVVRITGDSNNTRDHGIYLLHGLDNTLRGNIVIGASGYGIHIYDEHKSEDPPGFIRRFDRILVEGNYVEGSRHRSGVIANAHPTATMSNVTLRGNILAGNNHVGLVLGRGDGFHVAHNTFYNNGRQGLNIYAEARRVSVAGNLFAQLTNSACRENCSWFEPRQIGLQPGAASPSRSGNFYWPASVASDGDSDPAAVMGDPRFIDPAAGDFRLHPSSPACRAEGAYGALPCSTNLLLRPVVLEPEQSRLRFQVIGSPGAYVRVEANSLLTPIAAPWAPLGAVRELGPSGAFVDFPWPLGASSRPAAQYFRARLVPQPAP